MLLFWMGDLLFGISCGRVLGLWRSGCVRGIVLQYNAGCNPGRNTG